MSQPPRVKFPRDERPHNVDYEWWYAHGYLSNEAGRRYGFMYCFFKLRKEALARYFPQVRAFPSRTVYQLHLGLTDMAAQTHHADELTFVPWLGQTRIGRLHFGVRFGSNWLKKLDRQRYALHAEHHRRTLDLHMFDEIGPVLHGRGGALSVRGHGETIYYSLPRLKVEGELRYDDAVPEYVHGSGWFDHQWGNFTPKQPFMYWTWMGVQFDDGGTLMLFQFYDNAGNNRAFRGTWLGPRGEHKTVSGTVTPRHTWHSAKSGTSYAIDYDVAVASLRLTFSTHADVQNQEMHSTFFNYWEGAASVIGHRAGKAIRGKAYVEVTGMDHLSPAATKRRLAGK